MEEALPSGWKTCRWPSGTWAYCLEETELAVEKLQRHKSAGTSHIPLELLKHALQYCGLKSTYLLILFVIKKNESVIAPIYKKGDEGDCSNYRGISVSLNKY
jgi:hypothetical protein